MYATDIISDDYKKWADGDKVLLKLPVNSGKSTFITSILHRYALSIDSEILYLTNRKILETQLVSDMCKKMDVPYTYFENDGIKEFPGITFITYQAMEEKLGNNTASNSFKYYKFIVTDEISYFSSDMEFNPKMVRIEKWIENMERSVLIFISATMDDTIDYIWKDRENWDLIASSENRDIYQCQVPNLSTIVNRHRPMLYMYTMDAPKRNFRVFIFDDIDEIVSLINNDKTSQKWLIFQSNKEKAKKNILGQIKVECDLLTADNKQSEVMQQITTDKEFSAKALIATKVLDVGVSIHDHTLLNIVMNSADEGEFTQMLGRRRIGNPEEIVNIYIPRRNAKYFGTIRRKQIMPKLEFLKLHPSEIIEEIHESKLAYDYFRQLCDVKNGKIQKNWIAEVELKKKLRNYLEIEAGIKENLNYFADLQMCWIGKSKIVEVIDLAKVNKTEMLKMLVEELKQRADQYLDDKAQLELRKELKKYLKYLVPEIFSHNKRIPGLQLLNRCLAKLQLPFYIESISQKKEGEKTKWIVKNTRQ